MDKINKKNQLQTYILSISALFPFFNWCEENGSEGNEEAEK